MAIVPSKLQDFLDWADLRSQAWQASPTSIGITAAQATAFVSAALLARERYNQQLTAIQAAKNATESQQDATRDCRRLAADLIRDIKAFAEQQAKPAEIYILADLPVPTTPVPLPPPGKPNTVTVGIVPTTGAITLKWKVTNPQGAQGTSYIVRRRTGTTGEFAFVGVTGQKQFTDSTFVAGPDMVQYTIQGQRSDLAGPLSDIVIINFGRTGPTVTVENATIEAPAKKEAA